MNLFDQDAMGHAMAEARKTSVWDKLTAEQRQTLVSKYIAKNYDELNTVERRPIRDGARRAGATIL